MTENPHTDRDPPPRPRPPHTQTRPPGNTYAYPYDQTVHAPRTLYHLDSLPYYLRDIPSNTGYHHVPYYTAHGIYDPPILPGSGHLPQALEAEDGMYAPVNPWASRSREGRSPVPSRERRHRSPSASRGRRPWGFSRLQCCGRSRSVRQSLRSPSYLGSSAAHRCAVAELLGFPHRSTITHDVAAHRMSLALQNHLREVSCLHLSLIKANVSAL